MAWLDSQGNYYEGDRASLADIGVPQRPSPVHSWVDGAWVEDPVKVEAAQEAQAQQDPTPGILDDIVSWIAMQPTPPQSVVDYAARLESLKVEKQPTGGG